MMNVIRADMYRILRGKGIYITIALLLGLVALTVIGGSSTVIGIQMWGLEESLGVEKNDVLTGLNAAVALCQGMDNFVWFMLPLLIFTAAPMFSHGAIKNCLSCGMSRTKLYMVKLLLSAMLCILELIIYLGLGMLIGTLNNGFGGPVPEGWWLTLLKTASSQMFILLALNAVGIFLVFTSKRTAITNSAFIAFCTVPLIILLILLGQKPDLIWLYDFDLMGNLKKFGYLNSLQTADIIKGFSVGAFWIIIPTVAGISLFKRAEIK